VNIRGTAAAKYKYVAIAADRGADHLPTRTHGRGARTIKSRIQHDTAGKHLRGAVEAHGGADGGAVNIEISWSRLTIVFGAVIDKIEVKRALWVAAGELGMWINGSPTA
jgi:hypothetical protein